MAQRLALILGGSGALGRSLVEAYSSAVPALSTICIDYRPNPQASFNIPMSKSTPPSELVSQVSEILKGQKLAAVVNAAGGWTGGSLGDPEFLGQVDAMLSSSVGSAALASHLAALHLQENGLLVLFGAAGALGPTPSMVAYGLAKNAVHHLVKSAAAKGSGLPAGAKTVGILP